MAENAKEQKKPSDLVICVDNLGCYNVSAYDGGVMGCRTPNIDRIAVDGAMRTDGYGQQPM